MAEALDQTGAILDVRVRRGDAWPNEPLEVICATDDTGDTPVPGVIASARLTVRKTPTSATALAFLDSDADAALAVSLDGSTVTVAQHAIGTAVTSLFPITDQSVPAAQREPCAWDLQILKPGDLEPETIVSGTWTVLPDVTRP